MRLLGTAIVLAVSIMAALQARAEPIDDLAHELLPWVEAHTKYSAQYVAPVILFSDIVTINKISYGDRYIGQTDVEALTTGHTILLLANFEIGKDNDTLVHEMVHVLQNENAAQFTCKAAREFEAYNVSNQYVDETGIGQKVSDSFLYTLKCSRWVDWHAYDYGLQTQ